MRFFEKLVVAYFFLGHPVHVDLIILLYLQTGIHLNSHSFSGTQFVTVPHGAKVCAGLEFATRYTLCSVVGLLAV